MQCTSCGAELPDGAAFCPDCGAAKVGMTPIPGMTGAPVPDPSAEPGENPDANALGRAWAAVRSTFSR